MQDQTFTDQRTIDRTLVTEMVIALRMTLCAQQIIEHAPIVRFDQSAKAVSLSADSQAFALHASQCNVAHCLWIPQNAVAGDMVRLISDSTLKAMPCAVAWENNGIFFCGSSAIDAQSASEAILNGKSYENPMVNNNRRLEGCIAVITGSAQGFGAGIAEELSNEGAHVIIADINEQIGNEFSNSLCTKHNGPISTFCKVDVTSLESIQELVYSTVRTYGGIDMFISNAGVLKAGALHEMDEASFDLVTNVNYKAFFLCTKASAQIMKVQNQYCNDHFMDIVQINSKSGLEGSNKNFAYAGSKFGGIGLTQSFALELIVHNIKVNAICPGNFFEGPLWSDPDRGLFVQYLRAGKVPGAKTIDDVKKFYTDKVPMKRGCTPSDVAKAILYLFEQQYETGQALPVTGGQVMLK